MWKFVKDHILEELIVAIFALLAFIGSSEIEHLRSELQAASVELNNLECKMTTFSAERESAALEAELGNAVLADLTVDSIYLKGLASFGVRYGKLLTGCGEGQIAERILDIYGGIIAYADRDLDLAATKFAKVSPASSLSHRFLGVSLLSKASQLRNSKNPTEVAEAIELQRRGSAAIINALRFAKEENDSLAKDRVLSNLKCVTYGLPRDASGNSNEIECFKGIISRGAGDHNTFYNISAVYARTGQFDKTIETLKSCIDANGTVYITKRFIDDDDDFAGIRTDPSWGPRFKDLAAQFQY
jgi:hypothetical protein